MELISHCISVDQEKKKVNEYVNECFILCVCSVCMSLLFPLIKF